MDPHRKIIISRITLVLFAIATFGFGVGATRPGHQSHCSTGTLSCCNQLFQSTNPHALGLLTKNGIDLGVLTGVKGMIGAGCTPVTAIGVGSSGQCASQAACCEKTEFNSAVAVGCTPINAGL